MRIVAPSTGHSSKGFAASPVSSISIAPKPPTSASSIACSISVRNESEAFGYSSERRRIFARFAANATFSGSWSRFSRTCQSIAATRSLIRLMARRTTGVSANLRRFAGVGLGSARDGNAYGDSTDGKASVFRSTVSAFRPPPSSASACFPNPSIQCSFIFTSSWLLPVLSIPNRKGMANCHAFQLLNYCATDYCL